MKARFFDEDDKLVAIERLRANQQGVENDIWKWEHVREAVFDLKTWMWGFMMFSISVPSGGISTFGPLIIKAFGYDQFETILFNIPFGAVQLVATMGGAFVATKLKVKSPVLAFLSLPPIAGCVMLLYLPRSASAKAPLLVAYYLISVYPGITPLIYSWSAANTAGETKKKGMLSLDSLHFPLLTRHSHNWFLIRFPVRRQCSRSQPLYYWRGTIISQRFDVESSTLCSVDRVICNSNRLLVLPQ